MIPRQKLSDGLPSGRIQSLFSLHNIRDGIQTYTLFSSEYLFLVSSSVSHTAICDEGSRVTRWPWERKYLATLVVTWRCFSFSGVQIRMLPVGRVCAIALYFGL